MDLGDLADVNKYHDLIDIKGYGKDQLMQLHRQMVHIRVAERVIADKREKGMIGGPVHLGIGQEAVAVGISSSLLATDKVFGAHRSHAHVLALGSERRRLFSEVLGRRSGLSAGMGGSMHLWDAPKGFYGAVPIVAGTVSLAVGAGLAAKIQGSSDIGVSYFGDGAIEEGVVHEALNFAKTFNVPVLFVVENNMYASHMHISERQPSNCISRFAVANKIPFSVIDGNDVIKMEKCARDVIKNIRNGTGPALIEAVTHRQLGHVDWREDIDVGVNRSSDELSLWKLRDPIARLERTMLLNGMADSKFFEDMYDEDMQSAVVEWESIVDDETPTHEDVLNHVYSAPRSV